MFLIKYWYTYNIIPLVDERPACSRKNVKAGHGSSFLWPDRVVSRGTLKLGDTNEIKINSAFSPEISKNVCSHFRCHFNFRRHSSRRSITIFSYDTRLLFDRCSILFSSLPFSKITLLKYKDGWALSEKIWCAFRIW